MTVRLLLLWLALFAASLQAQTKNIAVAGPYGVPRLVLNEGERWDVPIKVYEDSQLIMFVPDLTSPDG